MNKDELLQLREQLLTDITPLIIENADAGADRFSLLMRLIQGGKATSAVYNRAYQSAKSIEDTPERLDALMALLDEVEVDLSSSDSADQAVEEAPQPAPEQQPEHHDQQDNYQDQNHEQHHDQ